MEGGGGDEKAMVRLLCSVPVNGQCTVSVVAPEEDARCIGKAAKPPSIKQGGEGLPCFAFLHSASKDRGD